VKTQQVARSRDQRCGDIELAGYLANVAGPVPLVLDLRIAHDRFGSSPDPTSGVQLAQSNRGQFHYRRAAFSSQLKSKVGNIIATAAALRITLNIDDAPLFLGIPVPRATQCMRGV
jgi:hypothetical protein